MKGSKRVLRYRRWRVALRWSLQFLFTAAVITTLFLCEWTFGENGFWVAYACVVIGAMVWIPLELRAIRRRYWKYARWRNLVHERHRRMLQRKMKSAAPIRPAA